MRFKKRLPAIALICLAILVYLAIMGLRSAVSRHTEQEGGSAAALMITASAAGNY
jgi:hypothetical protein